VTLQLSMGGREPAALNVITCNWKLRKSFQTYQKKIINCQLKTNRENGPVILPMKWVDKLSSPVSAREQETFRSRTNSKSPIRKRRSNAPIFCNLVRNVAQFHVNVKTARFRRFGRG
jgi:hypothetical protein